MDKNKKIENFKKAYEEEGQKYLKEKLTRDEMLNILKEIRCEYVFRLYTNIDKSISYLYTSEYIPTSPRSGRFVFDINDLQKRVVESPSNNNEKIIFNTLYKIFDEYSIEDHMKGIETIKNAVDINKYTDEELFDLITFIRERFFARALSNSISYDNLDRNIWVNLYKPEKCSKAKCIYLAFGEINGEWVDDFPFRKRLKIFSLYRFLKKENII